MNWRDYEIYITQHFKRQFPDTSIRHNVRRMGSISKTKRQIDILIEGELAGFNISVIVDCKYFNKKVDVKDVEAFLSFLLDLKASKGIMITNVGYSEAAYNRATYDTQDTELRIINFNDLEQFQGFMAIPYSGKHCAVVAAPDGWIIDAAPKGPYVASLYPAGLSQNEAANTDGFIYLVFSHKDKALPDMDSLISMQEQELRQHYRKPKIKYIDTISRKDCNTKMRIIEMVEVDHTRDITIFLDYPNVVLFLTLLTPVNKMAKYKKKLEWIAQKLIKGKVRHVRSTLEAVKT